MGNIIFSRPFNPKSDRHDTAIFQPMFHNRIIEKLSKICYIPGMRESFYDIIAKFEKKEGRAPYVIEVAYIY